ncbi:hypothetical protein JCM17844_14050 [Iodidimonas gelatinilytica]|uniref:Uncharacterized protein n=1 Tax=Iodidimonas gelatinilytica TaxID=1236966 RepID=A0A5A7MS21_9PROT|nr:hypothetical protein [Iodidimonas gelatinilytica]GEQ97768.1 hypothetical protein JCM17844_14050 [Iodidimonas gelatinilytica]GER01283.1 hypothetical protein JCM17845_19060 [Iodidimonas gelatinilytica]
MHRATLVILALVIGACGAVGAGRSYAQNTSTEATAPAYKLDIEFSGKLLKRMKVINRVERIREERFRKSLVDEPGMRSSLQSQGVSLFRDVEWAGERLIPDLHGYTVEALVRGMMARNLARAVPDFAGEIRLKLDRIKVDNHPVAYLRASHSYVVGKLEVRDADGHKIFEDKMTFPLVADFSLDSNYDGPRFAFAQTDESNRVGPVLAHFVEKALERVWPDQEEAIVGPVIIRLAGPDVSTIR